MKKKVIFIRPYGYYGGSLVIDKLSAILREHGVEASLLYTSGTFMNTTGIQFWKWWIKDSIRKGIYNLFLFYYKRANSSKAKSYRLLYQPTMDGLKRKHTPLFNKKNTIVVYPDIIYGNFFKAKHVVRWLLYFNRYSNLPNAVGKNDLVICYRKYFNDWQLNPRGLEVSISYFDAIKYKQYNFGERRGKCYIIRKGRHRKDLPQTFDGPVIDYGISEEEIVKILNTVKYCYSYDTQTFYTSIAAVCGSIPIVVLEPGKKKEDYLSKEELEKSVGIAYGDSPEEIDYAISTRQDLIKKLDYSIKNENNTIKFIQYLRERFGDI